MPQGRSHGGGGEFVQNRVEMQGVQRTSNIKYPKMFSCQFAYTTCMKHTVRTSF